MRKRETERQHCTSMQHEMHHLRRRGVSRLGVNIHSPCSYDVKIMIARTVPESQNERARERERERERGRRGEEEAT
jgi:hypothetical protein